jgi:hypothetical protein
MLVILVNVKELLPGQRSSLRRAQEPSLFITTKAVFQGKGGLRV